MRPRPIPRVLFPWHIADREESTKCGAPSRQPAGEHRHSGFANDNESAITIHAT